MRLPRAIFLLAFGATAAAHHDPAVTLEMLDAQILKTPGIAELYYQRADELLAMTRLDAAEADLHRALALRSDYLPAKRLMARICQVRGNAKMALEVLQKALADAPADHAFLVPGCLQMEGELLLSLNHPAEALNAFNESLAASTTPDFETIRLRSEALRILGQHDERIASLQAAWQRSQAVILRNDWLEALIDAGRGTEALPCIQTELSTSRFQSSWLIRRARVFFASGRTAEAKADLAAAIAELNTRLTMDPPPVTLLLDRCLAQHLLGDDHNAQIDLAKIRQLGTTASELQRLTRLVAEKPAAR